MLRVKNDFRVGLAFAMASAVSFGMSGPFAKSLMTAGWSPTAAVAARLAGGALMMAVFASIVRPGWLTEARRHLTTIVLYGAVPIAGAQLCYYNAVDHLSVGVALLLEYTSPVLVVGWIWATTRQRPSNRTLAGVALAIVGITLVLDVFSGAHINTVGVVWGLGAAICAVCYFMMSDTNAKADKASGDGEPLHPITLAAGGLLVGTAAIFLLGLTGIMPMTVTSAPVIIAGFTTHWLVPVFMLGLFSTAMAYTLGILGVAMLRPGFASLVGLSEVLCAVLWAWLLVGEAMTTAQAVGGAVVLAGLILARSGADEQPAAVTAEPVAEPVAELGTEPAAETATPEMPVVTAEQAAAALSR
jgi:drug/metabolite transporter (DMT)-like permease